MPASLTKKRRHESRNALSQIARECWSIHEPAADELMQTLMHMADSGQAPAASRLPKCEMGESRSGYVSARFVGSTCVIPIVGLIQPRANFYTLYYGGTACETIQADFQNAMIDGSVKQIVFFVDSPGGSVSLLEETAQMLFANRSKKPTTAYIGGLCASAAYYLASAASRMIAGPSSAIGSIGAKMMHVDQSKMLDDWGIKVTDIQFGKHKTDGSPFRPLDAQGRKSLQEMVDSFGNQFVAAVARQRGISAKQVIENYGEGKLFIAAEALSRKMIDGIGTIQVESAGVVILEAKAIAQSGNSSFVSDSAPAGALPAGAASSSGGASGGASSKPTEKENVKIKALLFGLGLITSQDVDDAVVMTALHAFASAKGVDSPIVEGKIDEAKAIAMLTKPAASAPLVASVAPLNPVSGSAAVQAAKDREIAEAVEADRLARKTRSEDIRGLASLFNTTSTIVSAADIDAAVDSDKTVDAIRKEWQAKMSADPHGRAISSPTSVNHGEDRFAAAATAVLLQRSGAPLSEQQQQVANNAGPAMRMMSLYEIATQCLRFCGISTEGLSRDLVASMALQGLSPGGRSSWADATAYNRPGDFPSLMSNLAGMYLKARLPMADTTYQYWASQLPDADDFRADTYLAVGTFSMLDEVADGEAYKELEMTEEVGGWISVTRKGNAAKLTPVMIVNGSSGFDAFMQQLQTLEFAHNNTINMACLKLLAGNVNLVDGTPLFHATRGNLIAGGGAPSAPQADKHKLAHRRIKGVGTDLSINSIPRLVLVSPDNETAAIQTYAPFGTLPEIKGPTTDTTINVHRGSVQRIVVENNLDAFSSSAWYTFDTLIRTISYQFMAGYGAGGSRMSWYKPDTDCRYFGLEGRFGTSAIGWRGVVKNPGS